MSKTKKIKCKTAVSVTEESQIQATCKCGYAGTVFTQEDLLVSIEAARKEAAVHYTPKVKSVKA